MAHFYVSTENSRGNTVTASGTKRGQTTHCRGWNSGVEVRATVDESGRDCFHVYRTGGSNDGGAKHLIGVVVGDSFVKSDKVTM